MLDSMNNFPRGMLIEYAKQNADAVKKMFVHLYDETKDMTERVLQFQEEAQILCEQYSASLQHYQRLTAISVYLWLRYPDKYSIFKYSVCRAAALELESDFMPKRGNTAENIKGNLLLLDEITKEVAQDTELIRLFEKARDQTVYQDTCALISACGGNTKHVISAGGYVPWDTPVENIKSMMQAVEDCPL